MNEGDTADGTDVADVLVVGAGVAGLTCSLYTAREGLETVVADGGPSILERNAHLENVPGFPGGVDARRFLRACRQQAVDAGATLVEARVEDCSRDGSVLEATTGDGRGLLAERVVAASWSDASYLESLAVETRDRGSKTYVVVDEAGRTDADGVYAAGRLAGQPHQTVISAGHGATVALAVIEDADVPFYHDWVAPEGYFTGRDRDVPPGCEEIDDAERTRRESAARDRQRELLDEQPTEPRTHPSLREE